MLRKVDLPESLSVRYLKLYPDIYFPNVYVHNSMCVYICLCLCMCVTYGMPSVSVYVWHVCVHVDLPGIKVYPARRRLMRFPRYFQGPNNIALLNLLSTGLHFISLTMASDARSQLPNLVHYGNTGPEQK